MKRVFSIVAIMLLSFTVITNAQTVDSVLCVQGVDTLAVDVIKGKGIQLGVSIRYGSPFFFSLEEAVILSGGYRFNKRNYLGLNVGVAKVDNVLQWKNSDDGLKTTKYIGCPLSLDYIHYFPVGKTRKHSIILGAEGGYILPFGKSYIGDYHADEYEEEILGTPIIMIKTGMEHHLYKRLHLNWGIRVGVLALGLSLGVSI